MTKNCAICGKEFVALGSSKTCSIECSKKRLKEYMRQWKQTPKGKESARRWRQSPNHKKYNREFQRKRRQLPKIKEYYRHYQRSPEYKEKSRRRKQKQYQKNSAPNQFTVNFLSTLNLSTTLTKIAS